MTDETPEAVEASNDSRQPPPPDQRWPHVPPCEREVYGFMDPQWQIPMVAMTQHTWQEIHKEHLALVKRLEQLTHENVLMKKGIHPEGPKIVLPS